MSRILKIILSITGLVLFYLWLSSTFQSCKNKNQETDNIELVNDALDDGEELLDNIDEEDFEDDEIDYSENTDDNEFVEFEDETFDEEDVSSSTTTSNTTSSSYSDTRGQYLLISGNYLVDTNAEKMQSKLKNMGYSNAEIAVFNGSNYQTVIANRYHDYSEALEAASTLKQKGIDCYVKKRS